MARRRRNKDFEMAAGVAQLIALALLAAVFVPGFRHILGGFVAIVFWLFMLVLLAGSILYSIHRHHRSVDAQSPILRHHCPSPATPIRLENGWSRAEMVPNQPPKDLIQQLRAIDWFQFEKIVALTYKRLGYSVNLKGGANPDGGIDLVIEKAGQQKAVQCKQWKTWNVGVKAMREFLGAMTDAGIRHGVFVTLGGYTSEAKVLAGKHGIEILDETKLAQMLESVGAKRDAEVLALLNDKTKYCPKCERKMILRTAKKGLGSGNSFWGCAAYPKCRFTMQVS